MLEDLLVDKMIPLLDIHGGNILVRYGEGGLTPVIIDFKRYGNKTYPFQLALVSEKAQIEKIRRRFQRLRDQHQKH